MGSTIPYTTLSNTRFVFISHWRFGHFVELVDHQISLFQQKHPENNIFESFYRNRTSPVLANNLYISLDKWQILYIYIYKYHICMSISSVGYMISWYLDRLWINLLCHHQESVGGQWSQNISSDQCRGWTRYANTRCWSKEVVYNKSGNHPPGNKHIARWEKEKHLQTWLGMDYINLREGTQYPIIMVQWKILLTKLKKNNHWRYPSSTYLFSVRVGKTINQGTLYVQPKLMHYFYGKSLKIYHIFTWSLIPQKMCNFMIPVKSPRFRFWPLVSSWFVCSRFRFW